MHVSFYLFASSGSLRVPIAEDDIAFVTWTQATCSN